jgi:5-methylcytosine-specific restriction endonuclease McrA
MRASCKYCGRVHPRGYRCPKKPVFRKNKQQKDHFRSTNAWQKVRKAVYQRDLGLCQWCLHEGRYTGGEEVHHIVPLIEDYDLRLEKTNLILLCPACHHDADDGRIAAKKLREIAEKNEVSE